MLHIYIYMYICVLIYTHARVHIWTYVYCTSLSMPIKGLVCDLIQPRHCGDPKKLIRPMQTLTSGSAHRAAKLGGQHGRYLTRACTCNGLGIKLSGPRNLRLLASGSVEIMSWRIFLAATI